MGEKSAIIRYEGVVIITGGSKGIGEGCARAFCAAGGRVVIADVDETAGRALAEALNAAGPGQCLYLRCDVRDTAQLNLTIEAAAAHFGQLDCLINNAGWHPPHKPIDDFSIEEFKDLLDLNLIAVFAGCKFALPFLRKTHGSIINISSLVAVIGQEHATTYCATKGAVSSFTKALAIDEARHGVRVNAVLPGNVMTSMRIASVAMAPDPEALNKTIESWQWIGRSASMDEIGQICLFLASEAASYVTGIEFHATGGAELGYGAKLPATLG